jgi:hypothetical protein
VYFLLATRHLHALMFEDMAQPQINQEVSDPGPELRNTTTTLLILASVFVVLRFAARFKRGLSYGADDWMIVVALVRTYRRISDLFFRQLTLCLVSSLFALLLEDSTMAVSSIRAQVCLLPS